eukprot:2268242-Pyramimonas_sp.AAC.1
MTRNTTANVASQHWLKKNTLSDPRGQTASRHRHQHQFIHSRKQPQPASHLSKRTPCDTAPETVPPFPTRSLKPP